MKGNYKLILVYGLDYQGSIPGRGNDEIFFPRHHIQTGPAAHPVSYPTGTGGLLPCV